MPELTGPKNCPECGTELTYEIAKSGDAGPLVIPANGEMVEIPGLYVCTDCAGSIMVGEREATVTAEDAVTFLTQTYLPRLQVIMQTAMDGRDMESFAMAFLRFTDCAQAIQTLDPSIGVGLAVVELDELEAADLPNGQRRSTIDQN